MRERQVLFTPVARLGYAFQWRVWRNSKYNCRGPGAQGSHPVVLLDRTENFLAGLAKYIRRERKLEWGRETSTLTFADGVDPGGLW